MKNIPQKQLAGFPLPPVFPFGPDALETQTEFKQRLHSLLKHPIIAGYAQLAENEYNQLSKVLPISVKWEKWALPFQHQTGDIHLRLQDAQVEQLNQSSHIHPLYAQLKLVENGNKSNLDQDGILFKITGLHLKTKDYLVPVYHQLPPTLLYSLEAHQNWAKAVSFTQHDSLLLASASEDNTIRLWQMGSGQPNMTLEAKSGVNSIAFSPDGKLIASGSNDTFIRLWNVETGQEQHILQGHKYTVFSVAFSPNGQILASGSVDKTVRLWDVYTGRELFILRGHDSWVFSVAFSPDGRFLASGSRDKTVKLWDVSNGNEILTLPHY
jgi:WD40 repeat protein